GALYFRRGLARRGPPPARPPEPRRDLRQVIGEALAAARADVADEAARAGGAAAAHQRLPPVRGVHGGTKGPVGHAARLVFLRRLVEHAHPTTGVALLGAHD